MNWQDVGKQVLPWAPTIGSILGGLIPIPGGSTIGQEAGQILATALGVDPTPDAVGNAINQPGAASAISAAESEAAAKWQSIAQQVQAIADSNSKQSESINQTMRAELAAGQKWYAWRNLYGYSIAYECMIVSNIVFYAILFRPDLLSAVQNAYSFFITWYTLRFGLLGYLHNQATTEKVAAVTGQVPAGFVAGAIKAIKGK